MCTAIKHLAPDRVKPSFVIFYSRALWRSAVNVRVPGCQNYKWRLTRSATARTFYSCSHMATVRVKGLNYAGFGIKPLSPVFVCQNGDNCRKLFRLGWYLRNSATSVGLHLWKLESFDYRLVETRLWLKLYHVTLERIVNPRPITEHTTAEAR